MDLEKLVSALENQVIVDLSRIKNPSNQETGIKYLECMQSTIDAQLKVTREALDFLMCKFSTVRPILSKVKSVYEAALDIRNTRLEGYIELTRTHLGMEKDCKYPASEFLEMKKMVLNNLDNKISELHNTIKSLDIEQKKSKEIIKELRKELEISKKQTEREFKSRKVVLSDIIKLQKDMVFLQNRIKMNPNIQEDNNLKSHQMKTYVENKQSQNTGTFSLEKDPILLQEALNNCQEANLDLSTQLCALKACYADVVPQKKFEAAEDLAMALKNEKRALEECIRILSNENQTLQNSYDIIKCENKSLLNKIDDLETGSSIISCQWKRCAKYIPGGMKRWEKLSSGKTNSEKLELLAKEFEIMAVAASYYDENVIFT